MTALYQLALLGAPTEGQISEVRGLVAQAVERFSLQLGREVGWEVLPDSFNPSQQRSSAAAFFGGDDPPTANVESLLDRGVPIIPVSSSIDNVRSEIPEILRPLNCLAYDASGPTRVSTALLECAGLLPRQRRVFISYRRDEAREAALQLFDSISARQFDVFLDTHGIGPAEDFQAMLWHRLCDSDVLLMLDTPSYFESRWTSAEYGRALAKGISVLRVGWPDATPSSRTATASRAELLPEEVDSTTGRIAPSAVERICLQLENVRSQSHAVRSLNLTSNLRRAVQGIGGRLLGVGPSKAMYVELPDGRELAIYPSIGVPTSTTMHEACMSSPGRRLAVVYDHVGLHPKWLHHLDWLGQNLRAARWVRASEAGWQFADWEG